MVEVSVDLTPRNVSRLRNGHTVQLKHSQIGSGVHKLHINDALAKKIEAALKKQKGVKIQLSAEEIDGSGLRLKDIGRALKGAAKVYREKVRPVVAPVIRKVLTEGIKKGLPAAAIALGQPQLAAPAAMIANELATPAVNALGRATGGFGVKKRKRTAVRLAERGMAQSAVHHSDDYTPVPMMNPVYGGSMSGFLPGHPAMNAGDDTIPDHSSKSKRKMRGGSFKMAGN